MVEAMMLRLGKSASLGLTVLLGACVGSGSIGTTLNGIGNGGNTGGTMGLLEMGDGNVVGGSSGFAANGGAPSGGTTAFSNLVAQTLGSCGVSTTGSASVQTIDVPSTLTGANWGAKALICQQGGWDLTRCGGKSATFTSFDSSTPSLNSKPMTIWV